MIEHLDILAGAADAADDLFLTAGVTIEAAAADKPGPRRFDMVAYTGGFLHLPNFDYPVVANLAGMTGTEKSRPVLKDHKREQLVGHTDAIANDGKQLTASGIVSGGGPAAREVLHAADHNFPWQASIGAKVLQKEYVPPGQSRQINGQTFVGPFIHASRTRLGEISFVVLGADDNTSARIAAEAAEGTVMTFEQWLKAKGFDPDTITDGARTWLKAQFDAEIQAAAAAGKGADTIAAGAGDDTVAGGGGSDTINAGSGDDDTVDPVKAQRTALAQDRKRVASFAKIEAKYTGQVPANDLHQITAQAIENGWGEDKYELALVRKSRRPADDTGAGVRGGRPGTRKKLTAAVITAALSLTAGISEKVVADQIQASDREQVMNDAQSSGMRGYSLHALMDQVIHAAGSHFSGSRKSNDYIRAALQAERTLIDAGMIEADGFSSLSLSNILSNVANKGLIAAYTAVEVCWPNICGVRNHSDFKVHTRYRLDSTGAFKKVGPDGELKNIGLTDASYTNQLATYGAIVALTRQMMMNDDLGAFMEIPNLLGRMAALRIEEAVFALLLSNPSSFFAAGNKNLKTGAGSALSIAALTASEQAFTDFVDTNGKPILVSPDRILVGSALRTVANQLNQQTTVIATALGSTSAKTVEPNNNPHVGKYKPFYSPYLNNTAIVDQDGKAITGQSSTLWYMLADPAVRAAIAVAFLNGQKTPTIESSQTEFDTLGMQWRAFHDFGVGMEETTAAVNNAGA